MRLMMLRRPDKAIAALALGVLGLVPSAFAQSGALASPTEKYLAQERFALVAPFPPGGPIDSLARIMADGLSKKYGQPAVVENLPGAAGNIGIGKVKRAKGDGRTLLVVPAGNLTINPTLMPDFPFNIERDFVPITMLAKAPNVLVAHPSTGFKTARDLIAAAKAKPDTLSFASPGVGSGLHLAGELFKHQAQVEILHVPYKGSGQALNDVLGGTVPLMFSNLPVMLSSIRTGKLVALGITDVNRSAVAPEIPTLAEQGVADVVVTSWYGLLAPAGTPSDVVEQLARDAREILNQPAVRESLTQQGLSESTMTPAAFGAYIRNETNTWAGVIKARRIVAQ